MHKTDPLGLQQRAEMSRSIHLLRLGFAQAAWHDAHESAAFLAGNVDFPDAVQNNLAAGVAVLYGRPFTGNNGLGALSKKFEEFAADEAGRRWKEMHILLLELRNRMFAHYDLPELAKMLPGVDQLHIYSSQQDLKVSRLEPHIPAIRFPEVAGFLDLQRRRIAKDFRAALLSYFGKRPTGDFILSENGIATLRPPSG